MKVQLLGRCVKVLQKEESDVFGCVLMCDTVQILHMTGIGIHNMLTAIPNSLLASGCGKQGPLLEFLQAFDGMISLHCVHGDSNPLWPGYPSLYLMACPAANKILKYPRAVADSFTQSTHTCHSTISALEVTGT